MLFATEMLEAAQKVEGVTVELRSFIAHCDVDDWGRTTGLSCVVTNDSKQPITVVNGYDGKQNLLVAETHHFPIGLRPMGEQKPVREVKVAPGASETIFTLSMHQILLLGDDKDHAEWRWGWAYSPPRGAPPISPVHPQNSRGWQAMVREKATVLADVRVNDQRVSSQPFEYKVRRPKLAGLRAEEVSITTAEGVVVSGKDFIAYHWPSHAVRIRRGVMEGLRKKFDKRLLKGVPFQFRVGGVVIYSGVFTTMDTKRIFKVPTICVYDGEAVDIEYGYHLAEPPPGPDPRKDERLRQVLLGAGLLLQ